MIMAGGLAVTKTVSTAGRMANLTVPALQMGRDGTLAYLQGSPRR